VRAYFATAAPAEPELLHSTENASSTHPLTSGVRYSYHACMLMADILNTRCKILKFIKVDIGTRTSHLWG